MVVELKSTTKEYKKISEYKKGKKGGTPLFYPKYK
jgi:hypothetical protein